MPLEVSFKISTNPTRLDFGFVETTGAYSVANAGGYGTPNLPAGAINLATLTIQKRGSAQSYTVNLAIPPDVTGTIVQSIANTDIGLQSDEKIPDGIYNITYKVYRQRVGQSFLVSEMDYNFAFTEGLKCCLRKLMKDIAVPKQSPCGCSDDTLKKLANAQALLDSVCYLVNCDQLDRAQEVIEYIQGYCDCNCQDCTD